MSELTRKYGDWALVTGASSGIGAEFCRQLAALKFNLVLVARRASRLEELAATLARTHGVETRVAPADLSHADFLPPITAVTDRLDIGVLVNSAGFALTGNFIEHRLEDELALMHVNCRAPMVLAHHFGQRMAQRGRGGIINVASLSAFMALPRWAQYAASKVYVLHLSEALWYELRPRGVDVLALCPGSTRTEFARVANIRARGMVATQVVKTALCSLGSKISVVPGLGNNMVSLLSRFLTRRRSVILGAATIDKAYR